MESIYFGLTPDELKAEADKLGKREERAKPASQLRYELHKLAAAEPMDMPAIERKAGHLAEAELREEYAWQGGPPAPACPNGCRSTAMGMIGRRPYCTNCNTWAGSAQPELPQDRLPVAAVALIAAGWIALVALLAAIFLLPFL